jgi:hypothetical protein
LSILKQISFSRAPPPPNQVHCDFAELFEGGFEVFDPLDAVHAIALARGRPERSETRDDEFLDENVGIGQVVGFFEAFIPEDVELRLSSTIVVSATIALRLAIPVFEPS